MFSGKTIHRAHQFKTDHPTIFFLLWQLYYKTKSKKSNELTNLKLEFLLSGSMSSKFYQQNKTFFILTVPEKEKIQNNMLEWALKNQSIL